jgi:hypothetical protein
MEEKLKEWGIEYSVAQKSKRTFVVSIKANQSTFRLYGAVTLLSAYFKDWAKQNSEKNYNVKELNPFTVIISFATNADAMLFKLTFLNLS